jgi:hypothetical protein
MPEAQVWQDPTGYRFSGYNGNLTVSWAGGRQRAETGGHFFIYSSRASCSVFFTVEKPPQQTLW